MSFAESLRTGFLIGRQLDAASDEAEKRQAEVKLLRAQADGMSATAQLHRQKLDQAMQHQTRLAAAFAQQSQAAPPGEQPVVGAGPQSRLQQQLSPQEDVPPMEVTSRQSGPALVPPPAEEAQQRQAFAARYGPGARETAGDQAEITQLSTELRRGGMSPADAAKFAPIFYRGQTPPVQGAPVPQEATPASGEPTETSVPVAPPQAPLGPPTGSSAVPQPGTVSSTPPAVSGPTLPDQGEPTRQRPAAPDTASAPDDTALLRNLSKTYFLNNQPHEGLALMEYTKKQEQLRHVATVYRAVLSDPGATGPQRQIAMAGLGASLIAAAQVDQGMKLFQDTLPLSDRKVIEQASASTRDVLLEQYQTGQPLDVAAANREARQRKNQDAIATRAPREPRQPQTPQTQLVETEAGVFVVDKETGQAKQVTLPGTGASPSGTQPLPGKKMTGEQSKAFNYGSRALQANTILDTLEAKGVTGANLAAAVAEQGQMVGGALGTAAAVVLGIYTGGLGWVGTTAGAGIGAAVGTVLSTPLANALRTPDEQLYAQSKLDFIGSLLRKESGAAISKDEYLREDKRYFPQSGDAPEVIVQKRAARLGVLATLSTEAGRPLALPQPTPPPQTGDPGIIPNPAGGGEKVRVQQPPATPKREVPEQMSTLLKLMSPETILGVSDAAIEGVQSPSDIPGLTVAQQRALLIRLQRRSQGH